MRCIAFFNSFDLIENKTFFNQNFHIMKRLNLESFKNQNIAKNQTKKVDQLLEQVLGNCHDKPKNDAAILL